MYFNYGGPLFKSVLVFAFLYVRLFQKFRNETFINLHYGDRFPVFFTWKMLGATLNETDNFTNSPTLKIAIIFQGRKRL